MSKFIDLKKRVYEYYEKNKNRGINYIAAHFLSENYPKTTIYRYIRHAQSEKAIGRKKGQGRKVKIATKTNIRRLTKAFDHQGGRSQRNFAKKL